MPTDYPTLAALVGLAALVYKAGTELAGMRKDIATIAEDVKGLSSLPERVAALEGAVAKKLNYRARPRG